MGIHLEISVILCFLVKGYIGEMIFTSPCVGDIIPIACPTGSRIALSSHLMGAQRCGPLEGDCCGNIECFYQMSSKHRNNLFELCSGKEECAFEVPESPTNGTQCQGYDGRDSSAQIKYHCIEDSKIVSFCGGTKIGQDVYLQYKTDSMNSRYDSCSCEVENVDGHGIGISAVDLRLFRDAGSYTECYSLVVTENCTSMEVPCMEEHIAHDNMVLTTMSKTIINLGHGGGGSAAVWLWVQGTTHGDNINVKCEPRDQYLDLKCPKRTTPATVRRYTTGDTTGSTTVESDFSTKKTTAATSFQASVHYPESNNVGLIAGGVCAGLSLVCLSVATLLVIKNRVKARPTQSCEGDGEAAHTDVCADNPITEKDIDIQERQHETLIRDLESFWFNELSQRGDRDLPSIPDTDNVLQSDYDSPDDQNKRSSGNSYIVNGCMYTSVDKKRNSSCTHSGNYDAVETVVPRKDPDDSQVYFVLHSNRGSKSSNVTEHVLTDDTDNVFIDKETNYPDVVLNAQTVSSSQFNTGLEGYETLPPIEKTHKDGTNPTYSRLTIEPEGNDGEDSDGYTRMHANDPSKRPRLSSTYDNASPDKNYPSDTHHKHEPT